MGQGKIGDIADDQLCGRIEIVPSPGRQIVENADGVAPRKQGVDEMGSDKSTSACYEIPSHLN